MVTRPVMLASPKEDALPLYGLTKEALAGELLAAKTKAVENADAE